MNIEDIKKINKVEEARHKAVFEMASQPSQKDQDYRNHQEQEIKELNSN